MTFQPSQPRIDLKTIEALFGVVSAEETSAGSKVRYEIIEAAAKSRGLEPRQVQFGMRILQRNGRITGKYGLYGVVDKDASFGENAFDYRD